MKTNREKKIGLAEAAEKVHTRVRAMAADNPVSRHRAMLIAKYELCRMNCADIALLYQKMDVYADDVKWVAEEAGINYHTLNRKLQGIGQFTAEEIAGLYHALDLTMEDVYEIFIFPYLNKVEHLLMELKAEELI